MSQSSTASSSRTIASANHDAPDGSRASVASPSTKQNKRVALKRELGFFGAVGLILGVIIGSGIFVSPKGVFEYSGSIGTGLVVWLICGILSTLAGICYTELGTMIPKSGGEFPILLKAYGNVPAFLNAWTETLLTQPAASAVLSLTFSKYTLAIFLADRCSDATVYAEKAVAIMLVSAAVFINCASVKLASKLVTVLSASKIIGLVVIIVGGIIQLAQGHTENFQNSFQGEPVQVRDIVMAIYQGLFAFAGWNQLNYVVEEIKNPSKVFPRAIATAMLTVTVLYLFANVSYFTTMSYEELLQSEAVGVTFAERALGVFAWIVPLSVALSVTGTVTAVAFSSGRISYAAAREELFPDVLSMIQVNRLTPTPSVILSGVMTTVFILPGNIQSLIGYFVFCKWIAVLLVCIALVHMRYTMPDLHRPIKVPLVIPIFMCICCVIIIVLPIVYQPDIGYIMALLFVFSGLLLYIPFVRMGVRIKFFDSATRFIQKFFLVVKPDLQEEDN